MSTRSCVRHKGCGETVAPKLALHDLVLTDGKVDLTPAALDLTVYDLDLTTGDDECTHGALVLTSADVDLTTGKADVTLVDPAGDQGRRGDCQVKCIRCQM